jgi:hypothetical protein
MIRMIKLLQIVYIICIFILVLLYIMLVNDNTFKLNMKKKLSVFNYDKWTLKLTYYCRHCVMS